MGGSKKFVVSTKLKRIRLLRTTPKQIIIINFAKLLGPMAKLPRKVHPLKAWPLEPFFCNHKLPLSYLLVWKDKQNNSLLHYYRFGCLYDIFQGQNIDKTRNKALVTWPSWLKLLLNLSKILWLILRSLLQKDTSDFFCIWERTILCCTKVQRSFSTFFWRKIDEYLQF